ncbi:hypothetical protein [Metabacillus bambusae]|uniref:HTH luxR-type domain-containing protein n=1 Tax=Metabacillus bambusae TaxID=2795218 RepID=A0ABS3N9S3_9BACI|nr:hypothetical protein [Metabacillus bambusae]MBO1515039.1 hypothetical protein [Metabacillus bambusae]
MTEQMIKWQVEEWIRDYNFMLREIARLDRLLNSASRGEKLTATYGIESAMPKGNGGISQAELRQMDIRERRLYKYEMVIHYLEDTLDSFKYDKHRILYDCMIEGMSYRAIAAHLAMSRDTIRKMRDEIIDIVVQKVQKDQFLQKLKSVKVAV